jgi:hypothetical protein
MTNNSINAFYSTVEMRQTNKQKVLECLKTERNQSRLEVGRKTGLGGFESQRRLSDLMNEGKIIITGRRKHGKHEISLYSVTEQLELFTVKNRPSFAKWAKQTHPEIWEKYRVLILKEL